jgi:hypothetical protein
VDEHPTSEEVNAFQEGVRQSLVDRGYLDVDALLELLDLTMAEFEVVAQQEGFPGPQIRDPYGLLWAPTDIAKWRGVETKLLCSFCGKSQGAVRKLIAGPGVGICNECIDLCSEIIEEEDRPAWHWRNIPAIARKVRLATRKARRTSLRAPEDDDEDAVVTGPPEKEEALDRLWHAYKAKGHDGAREQLILHYAPLVRHAAEALGPIQRTDLISYGLFGLIDSITKFEPGSGDSFATFAHPRILEAILDELQANAESDTPSSD